MQVVGIVCLVDDDVDKRPASQLLVQASRREVHIAGNVLAGFDQGLAHQVLRPATLVCRHDIAIAIVGLHHLLEVVEVPAAGVRLVAKHHAGPLPVAHCTGTAIGEQIDVHVLRSQQKGVVSCLPHSLLPPLARRNTDRLDHLDLPRFGPRATASLLPNGPVLPVSHMIPPLLVR